MSFFDRLVDQALNSQGDLNLLRPVVEKELIHHDILRELGTAGLLKKLVFIGGTCLRACYGSHRLSEDLDFTGGSHFRPEDLNGLAAILAERLRLKYGLEVDVREPVPSGGNVDTWKIRIITRPGHPDLPSQKIHLDICALDSYDPRPMVLRNHYGVEMGTSGLIIQAQSMREILADKMVALAFRPNRVKNRDLWDIGWLRQQAVEVPLDLIPLKIRDHGHTSAEFVTRLDSRIRLLGEDSAQRRDFVEEMRRFLPATTVKQTVARQEFWEYLTGVIAGEGERIVRFLENPGASEPFSM